MVLRGDLDAGVFSMLAPLICAAVSELGPNVRAPQARPTSVSQIYRIWGLSPNTPLIATSHSQRFWIAWPLERNTPIRAMPGSLRSWPCRARTATRHPAWHNCLAMFVSCHRRAPGRAIGVRGDLFVCCLFYSICGQRLRPLGPLSIRSGSTSCTNLVRPARGLAWAFGDEAGHIEVAVDKTPLMAPEPIRRTRRRVSMPCSPTMPFLANYPVLPCRREITEIRLGFRTMNPSKWGFELSTSFSFTP